MQLIWVKTTQTGEVLLFYYRVINLNVCYMTQLLHYEKVDGALLNLILYAESRDTVR